MDIFDQLIALAQQQPPCEEENISLRTYKLVRDWLAERAKRRGGGK